MPRDLRKYFASKAMEKLIDADEWQYPLTDEDMKLDKDGDYIKNDIINDYFIPSGYMKEGEIRYSVITTKPQRIARKAFEYADMMLTEMNK